ncbi:MAG: branched-chain amino acid ABC transporter permease [Mycetocola sp.]
MTLDITAPLSRPLVDEPKTLVQRLRPRTRGDWGFVISWTVGLILVALIPFLGLPPIFAAAVITTMVYIPSAVGQNLVLGSAGLLSMGQAAFVGVGAYTAAILALRFDVDGTVAIVAAVLVSAIVGGVVGIPALRLGGDYLFLVSIGFNLIVIDLANFWIDVTGGATGLAGIPLLTLFGVDVGRGPAFYFSVLAIVLIFLVLVQVLQTSRFGKTMEAVRDDEVAAQSVGIRPAGPKVWYFAIGSGLAGLTGGLLAYHLHFVGPQSFSPLWSLLIFQMAVIGGLGRISGSVVGAFIILLLPEVFRPLQDYRQLIVGVVIVVLMIYRPQGLLGKSKITNLIKK